MKRMMAAAAALVCAAEHAWAHPGHGVTDPQTPAHYVMEPVHALPLLSLLAAAALAACRVRARRRS